MRGAHQRTASRSELRRPLQMPEQRLASSTPAPSQAAQTAQPSPCLQQVQVIQQRLQAAVENNLKLQDPHKAPYHTVRQALPCWRTITEDKNVLEAIEKGVDIPLTSVPGPHFRSPPAAQLSPLHDLVRKYLSQGVVERLPPKKIKTTNHWIPVRPLPKRQGGSRLISAFCELNKHYSCPKFCPDSWRSVVTLAEDPTFTVGVTLDLKSWFHHLALSPKAQRWARFQTSADQNSLHTGFKMTAMPFGLKSSPIWAHRLARPIIQWARNQGMHLVWYVDDILLLGRSEAQLLQDLTDLIEMLTYLGVQVNTSKSHLKPTHKLEFLGHILDLRAKLFLPVKDKIRQAQSSVKRCLKGNTIVPRFLASAAGKVLDLAKSIANLHGLPKALMRAAALAVAATQKKQPGIAIQKAWSLSAKKPAKLRLYLTLTLQALASPVPTVMAAPPQSPHFHCYVDASLKGWGGSLVLEEKEIATAAERWPSSMDELHSTHKEATVPLEVWNAVHKEIPKHSRLTIHSDCSAVVWGLRAGSARPQMIHPLREVVAKMACHRVLVKILHIKGLENARADALSRDPDYHHYQLRPQVFDLLRRSFHFHPTIDLFASARNHQLPRFYSWRHCAKAVGTNAFAFQWREPAWLNPPWELAFQALRKVQADGTTALCLLPYWPRAEWWPLFLQLQVTPMQFLNGPLYIGPEETPLPAPKWRSVAVVIRGH